VAVCQKWVGLRYFSTFIISGTSSEQLLSSSSKCLLAPLSGAHCCCVCVVTKNESNKEQGNPDHAAETNGLERVRYHFCFFTLEGEWFAPFCRQPSDHHSTYGSIVLLWMLSLGSMEPIGRHSTVDLTWVWSIRELV